MTDNEIIKALECCKTGDCDNCPFYGRKEDCEVELPEEALDLCNRQKAEIKRLQEIANPKCQQCVSRTIQSAKSEAIKEVLLTLEAEAESSEEYSQKHDNSREQQAYIRALWKACNLVKEMTEQKE